MQHRRRRGDESRSRARRAWLRWAVPLAALSCTVAGSGQVSAADVAPTRVTASQPGCQIDPVFPADVVMGGSPNIVLPVTFSVSGTCSPAQLAGSEFLLYTNSAGPAYIFYRAGSRPQEIPFPESDISSTYEIVGFHLPAGVTTAPAQTTQLRRATFLTVQYLKRHGRNFIHISVVEYGLHGRILGPVSSRVYVQREVQHGDTFGPWKTVSTTHTNRNGAATLPQPVTVGTTFSSFRLVVPGTDGREPAIQQF